ncbi:MAG TPA: hypothetical protein VM031_00385, partial [Phycisphaerae bacterium]|nr:hypothetical protein [Phycisphaerae bacterium]
FTTVSENFGAVGVGWSGGDVDYNGSVGFGDYLLVKSNLGRGVTAPPPSVSVPESSWPEAAGQELTSASPTQPARPTGTSLLEASAAALVETATSRREEPIAAASDSSAEPGLSVLSAVPAFAPAASQPTESIDPLAAASSSVEVSPAEGVSSLSADLSLDLIDVLRAAKLPLPLAP